MSHTPTGSARLPSGFEKLFRTALILIPIGVLGNVVFSLLTTDRALLGVVAAFPRGYLALAVALALLPWITNTLRLLVWTHFLGFPLRFREAFQMTLAVDLGASVSPTAVGGGFFKWGMLVQRGVSPGAAASITSLPSFEDAVFFALALPAAVVYTASWNLPVFARVATEFRENTITALLVASAIALFTWAAARLVLIGSLGHRTRRTGIRFLAQVRRRLRGTWHDARQVFRLIRHRGKSRFALTMLLTAVQWAARYSVVSALVAFLGAPVQPVLFWLLQWVVFTLMTLIPTPGAAGGAEAVFFVIYGALLPERVLGIATSGWRFLTFYLQLALAALIFSTLRLRHRVRAPA